MTAQPLSESNPKAGRVRSERALSTLSSTTLEFAEITDESGLLNAACRIAIQAGRYRLARVVLAGDEDEPPREGARAGSARDLEFADSHVERHAAAVDFPCSAALRTGLPCIARSEIEDSTMSAWQQEAALLGIRAEVALPLASAGRTFGALCILDEEDGAFSGEEVAILTEVAARLAAAVAGARARLEQERANRELRDTKALYRSVVDSMAEGICLQAASGEILAINRAAERITGLTLEQMLGRTSDDPSWGAIHEDGSPFPGEDHPSMVTLRTGHPQSDVIMGIRRPNGELAWISVNSQPLIDEGETRPHAAVTTFHDVTTRRQARESLRRLNRELRAISTCTQTVLHAEEEQSLLSDVCRIICDVAGYRMAWVGSLEHDEFGTIRPLAHGGFEHGYLDQLAATWAGAGHERDPAGLAVRTGRSAVLEDLTTDPGAAPWREAALQRGYRSCIALPLSDDAQRTFGVLSIYSSQPGAFTRDETRFLEELSKDLAFGISVLRARKERRRLQQQLQSALQFFASMDRINVAIQENDDFEPMMRAVLDVILDVFECDRAFLLCSCDPESVGWNAPMERARPGISPAFCAGVEIPKSPEDRSMCGVLLAAGSPVCFGPGAQLAVPQSARKGAGVQAMLAMAVHRRGDKPCLLGLHQCSSARVWTAQEVKLLQEIGRRLSDRISTVLAHRSLRQNEARLRAVMQTIPDLVWMKDLQGGFLGCNRQFERLFGIPESEIIGKTDYDFMEREQADYFRGHDLEALALGRPCVNEEWITIADGGQRRLFETVKTPMRDELGAPIGVVSVARDITERHREEEQSRITATAFEAQEGIVIANAERVILRVNRAFTQITGYTSEDAVGQALGLLQPSWANSEDRRKFIDEINRTGSWAGEMHNRRKSGESYPAWITMTAVRDERGRTTHYVLTMSDITARKAAEREIEQLAYYDPLTQLPNRRLLMVSLQQALAASAEDDRRGALLFIDLDNFKILNDTIGHDVGDRLLCSVAQRLTASVRAGDMIARLGGDEFVVMLENLSGELDSARSETRRIGEQILAELNRPHSLAGRVLHSTPSIGVTLFRPGECTVEELVKQADIAMYQAKSAGRNALRFYDPSMQAALAARASLEAEIRAGIDANQFMLHFQPQVNSTLGIVGAEALLRWQHPQRGLVMPEHFIPVAEETGLIIALGQRVLEAACSLLNAWRSDPRTRDLHLGVNVSARQFRQPDFVEQVRDALENANAPAERLKLELTESLMLDDLEDTVAKMGALKSLGVGFSVDDFGTGHSSLSKLSQLPLDQLKIDKSFVHNLPDSRRDAVIVQAIITMARTLGLTVIAEGVETEAQREFLEHNRCPTYQGYLFSKPVGLQTFHELLKRG